LKAEKGRKSQAKSPKLFEKGPILTKNAIKQFVQKE